MNYRRQFCIWLIVTVLILVFAIWLGEATAGQRYPVKDWVKGGVFLGRTLSGNCLWKKFVKTGDTDDDPDTGEHQIIGYEPGNVVITRDGKDFVDERVPEKTFALRNRPAQASYGCRCPNFNE